MASLATMARDSLWPPDLARRPAIVRAGFLLGQYLFALTRDLLFGQLTLRAMSLVYITLLSTVPLLAFSFSLVKAFGVHNSLRPQLYRLLEPLGAQGVAITDGVMRAVDNVEGGLLGSLALLFFIYTAVAMVKTVEECFNHVWQVARPRSLVRRLTEYVGVLLLGPVALTVVIGLLASLFGEPVVRRLGDVEPFRTLLELGGTAIPPVVVILVFTVLYRFLPNAPVRIWPAALGGAVAGAAWLLVGQLFASFLAVSAARSAIYSTFAVPVSALVWLYLSWLILLAGAQLAFYVQNPAALRVGRRDARVDGGTRERIALNAMYLIGSAFRGAGGACTTRSIAAATGVPGLLLGQVIADLEAAGLISATHEEALVPGRDLAMITLAEVLAAVRGAPGTRALPGVRWSVPVAQVAEAVDAAVNGATGSMTLADLLDRGTPRGSSA